MADNIEAMFRLDGQVALVTGASRGLGRHFAMTLARAGADLAVAGRSQPDLDVVAADVRALGRRAVAVTMDVTRPATIAPALEAAAEVLGPVRLLINNSGIAITKPMLEADEADWRQVIDTNLSGAWFVAQAAARRMREGGGTIVNIASLLAFRTIAQLPGYMAAKAGLVHLTKGMAMELARHGIRVNALAPGYIETDMNRAALQSEPGRAMMRRIPQRRFGQLGDLDGPLLFLASDASRYVTGETILVDGGHRVSAL
ncbi:MAG: glucose 1-dehydrogenase [Alphaproteobacteria bacterium]|nr:glucose 1-dehydrogenase [Alphaproteobacteria bacterium]